MHGARRFNVIDLLRFVAAAAVVLFHYSFRGYMADGLSSVRYDSLAPYAQYGYLGVDLFFIISGFVIAMSIDGRSATAFAIARARRLYPAFWAACTLTVVGSWLSAQAQYHVSAGRWLANMSLATPLLREHFVDGVYWSLDVEIRFYALVSAVLALGLQHRLMAVLMAWLAVSALYLIGDLVPPAVAVHLCLQYAPLFVAGAAYSSIARSRQTKLDYVALAAAVPLTLIATLRDAASVASYYRSPLEPGVAAILVLSCHAVFALIAFAKWDIPRWRVLATAGGITYPLYLIHQNLGYMTLNAVGASMDKYALLALLFLAMCMVAWVIYRYAEPSLRRAFDRAVTVARAGRTVVMPTAR